MKRLTFHSRRWLILTTVLLLAALMRLPALDRVPPGWRDDELIEIGMDSRIEQGWRPLYIREAEGHEPLFHYLHAGTLALFGHNTYGYRWLPAAFGTLSTALLVALAWRLFGFRIAALTGAFYAVGLWPVMYSRIGMRHIGVMPFMLLTLYALVQISNLKYQISNIKADHAHSNFTFEICHLKFGTLAPAHRGPAAPRSAGVWNLILGLSMGLGLYVYYAAWAMPVMVIGLAMVLIVFDRPRFKQTWPGLVVGLAVAGAVFFPLGWDLAHGPRITRIEVTGAPVRALLNGDPRQVVETTLGTLGMFTFKGDPEWLYNYSGLPVFDWVIGALFYLGVGLCLLRLRDVRHGFLLIWLSVGISPAFISVPPGSFSHTFAAQGAVYLLPALALIEISNYQLPMINFKWVKPFLRIENWSLILVLWCAFYTVRWYFVAWPADGYLRFMYHGDTHDLARWLDSQPEGGDLAISTTTNELGLEGLALSFDLKRKDITPRLFDAEWALVFPQGGGQRIVLLSYPPQLNPLLAPMFQSELLTEYRNPTANKIVFRIYRDTAAPGSRGATTSGARVGNLTLVNHTVASLPTPDGKDGWLLTTWRVDEALSTAALGTAALANPLKLFVHLLDADGQMIGGDDRLNVLPSSLQPGDVFVQLSRLPRPAESVCAPCRIELGFYNPATNVRLPAPTGDHILLPVEITP